MVRWVIIILLVVAGAFGGLWGWAAWDNHQTAEHRAELDRKSLAFAAVPGNEVRMRTLARQACRCARTGRGSGESCWREFNRITDENGGGLGGAPVHPVSGLYACFGPIPPTEATMCVDTEWDVWQAPSLCTRDEYDAVESAMKADPDRADAIAQRMAREFAEADRRAP